MQRRQAMAWVAGAGLSLSAPVPAWAALPARPAPPPEAQALGPGVRLQGQMRFRYWGFHAYDAQLWVKPGFEPQRFAQHPLVLCLTYARTLKADDIAERSLEEIEHQQDIEPNDASRWLAALTGVLSDVQAGDRLSGLYTPPAQGRFFFNGQPTGTLNDARLVPLFFGIWLAPQTSEPRLRRALLGLDAPQGGDRHGA